MLFKLIIIQKHRFNRYIVECKVTSGSALASTYCDLIDTLWNVKAQGQSKQWHKPQDLIDTLWNVKGAFK